MRNVSFSLFLAAVAGSAVVACSATPENRFANDASTPGESTGDGGQVLGSGGGDEDTACKKMDLVFVIDNSGSMGEEQTNLKANFPKFVTVLNNFKTKSGDPVDYRLAVTTTGVSAHLETIAGAADQVGDDGAFRKTSGMTHAWLERSDAKLTTLFQTIAAVGTDGPSYEMPLESSRLALREQLKKSNTGFLRDDALLGVVFLTDEEDCSTASRTIGSVSNPISSMGKCTGSQEATSKYVSFFDTLKQGRERWATAVVAGPGPGSCSSTFGTAAEAPRLKAFVSEVGATAVFSSICDGDLAGALTKALSTFDVACQNFAQAH